MCVCVEIFLNRVIRDETAVSRLLLKGRPVLDSEQKSFGSFFRELFFSIFFLLFCLRLVDRIHLAETRLEWARPGLPPYPALGSAKMTNNVMFASDMTGKISILGMKKKCSRSLTLGLKNAMFEPYVATGRRFFN